jgi:hypothetical protein
VNPDCDAVEDESAGNNREKRTLKLIRQDLQDLQDCFFKLSAGGKTEDATPAVQKTVCCRVTAESFPALVRRAGKIPSILLILSDIVFSSCYERSAMSFIRPAESRAR